MFYYLRFTKYPSIFLDYCNNVKWFNTNPVVTKKESDLILLFSCESDKNDNDEMTWSEEIGINDLYQTDNLCIMALKHEDEIIRKLAEEKLRNNNTIIIVKQR